MVEAIKIRRDDFVSQLSTAKLNVADLKSDTRMKGIDVDAADLDGDGTITGKKEVRALFDQVDKVDKDGSDASVMVIDKAGAETATAAPMAAIGDLGKAADIQRKAKSALPGNDDILFLGMRTETKAESDALIRRGKAAGYHVSVAGGDSSTVQSGGQSYDLATDAGMRGFADSLGLPSDRADKVYNALKSNPEGGRDELAQLALTLNRGENGGSVPTRLVISGHHSGGETWGDHGKITDSAVQLMCRAFPIGAAQIEDFHLAGCYAAGRGTMDGWREALPNLQTAWGYNHTAPDANGGAQTHEAQWDSATRGRVGVLNRSTARGTRFDDEVLVWSKQGGYQSQAPLKTLDEARAAVASGENAYNLALSGTTNIYNPHSGSVRDYYSDLNDLRQHPDLPPADRAAIDDKIERTIRLLYNKDITKGWESANRAELTAGYDAAGLTKPDFTRMDRGDVMREITRFLKATEGSTDAAVVAARGRMIELRDLTPSALRKDWIQ